jgi:hypothetical protein
MNNRVWERTIVSAIFAIGIVSLRWARSRERGPKRRAAGEPSRTRSSLYGRGFPRRYALNTFEASLRDDQDVEVPWGYNRVENRDRAYPMVVGGCWNDIGGFSLDTRKRYPAFYVNFDNYSGESDGVALANFIDGMVRQGYRIDVNRVYLTGFSAGGSGSFKIVRGMLSKGKLFAAINRQAGQSETVLPDAAVEKTSLWYHIGLKDETLRITVARDTYANLKSHASNAKATERIEADTRTSYERTTKTLTRKGIETVSTANIPTSDTGAPATTTHRSLNGCSRNPCRYDSRTSCSLRSLVYS